MDKNSEADNTQEPKKTVIEVTSDDSQEEIATENTPEKLPETEENVTETVDEPSDAEDVHNEEVNDSAVEDVAEDANTEEQVEESEKTVEDAIAESEQETHSDVFQPDPEIDAAVDDIVRTESDKALERSDVQLAASLPPSKKSLKQKIGGLVKAWWNNKKLRYGTFAALFLVFVTLSLVPVTRYAMLNFVGVRVQSSMTVVDSQTRLPLRNINVAMQDKIGATDNDGRIQFEGLKLGRSTLAITKIGYADNVRDIVLGWGSNPIGEQEIVATGEQFTFVLRDWLNDEPINDAEATAGENSARADENGKIVLTVGQEIIANVEITVSADGYRQEVFGIDALVDGENEVRMVPDRKHAFISNRDGQFDLYTIDLDGQNEEVLLEATGDEREVPAILPHPNRNQIALVSSRDGEQNRDGFVLDGLFVLDTQSGGINRVTRSEQLQLIGWYEDEIVYWQVVEGTSRANPERSKLISYNTSTGQRTELAKANYFNDVRMSGDTITYAVSSFAVPQSQARLFEVRLDGESPVQILDKQVYSIFRTGYNTLTFNAADQKWYEQRSFGEVTETDQPTLIENKRFTDSPNGERTVWVEVRDGRGVMLIANTDILEEQQVISLAGLSSVQYWANNHTLVYRVIRTGETADYVIDVDNPEEIKLTDVTATNRLNF